MKDINILHQFKDNKKVYTIAESISECNSCPTCGVISTVKHSKYTRKIYNGSIDGYSEEITLIVRKFKCISKSCSQKIFVERLKDVKAYSRITSTVYDLIKLLALSTSAEKVSFILNQIGINISHDTIIRLMRNLPNTKALPNDIVNIGLDDFAFKKGKEYCTLICNMDNKEILDIIPSRDKESVANWLTNYPSVNLVSRDGSITYHAAISEALPAANQVSDKFHLIKNLLYAVSKYLRRKYPKKLAIDQVLANQIEIKEDEIPPKEDKKNLLKEERIATKWALILEIKEKHKLGAGQRELAREYSMSRATIRNYILTDKPIYYDKTKERGSKLDKFRDLIIKLCIEGKTQQEISISLNELGLKVARSNISAYLSKHNIKKNHTDTKEVAYNQIPKETTVNLTKVISCISKNKHNRTTTELEAFENSKDNYPEMAKLETLINEFKNLFKNKTLKLNEWIMDAKEFNISEINTFVGGIERDKSAVENSIIYSYNNGLLEGMVNKVKAIKRTSYGRCKFDLLRIKILNSQEIYG